MEGNHRSTSGPDRSPQGHQSGACRFVAISPGPIAPEAPVRDRSLRGHQL